MSKKKPSYTAILDYEANRILKDLNEIRELFEHNPSLGSAVEQTVQQLIRKFLPSTFEVTSGFAIDNEGNLSQQQDVLIIKKHQIGPLKSYAGFGVYPIEHIFASIEVKTKLTTNELQSAMTSLESLVSLSPKIPGESQISDAPGNLLKANIPICAPFTGIFSLETDIAIDRLLLDCQNHTSNKLVSKRLNIINIVGHSFGCWVERNGTIFPDIIVDPQALNHSGCTFDWENRKMEFGISKTNPAESLKAFMGLLLSFLHWYKPPPISLQKYLLKDLKLEFNIVPKKLK